MRFVNSIELSSILVQPQICSSNRLGAMPHEEMKAILKWQRKLPARFGDKSLHSAWKNHNELMPRRMAAVVEANGGHTKYSI